MGGGAGITWELELGSFPLKLSKGELVPARKPVIERWHTADYMNAMQDIRPDMLRLVSLHIADPNDTPTDLGGYDWCARMNGNKLSAISGGGYTRGPWQKAFPLTFSGQMHIDYYGDINVMAIVTYRRKREFETFYNHLFNGYRYQPSEATMDKDYGGLMGWYEWHWGKMEDRYQDR